MALLRTIERGFDNVNRTHLVMASGKLVLQKKQKRVNVHRLHSWTEDCWIGLGSKSN